MIEVERVKRVVKSVCSKLELDLRELKVLTEVGSNLYALLPVIAAYAGAEVFAWTRDSRFGKAEENISQCNTFLNSMDLMNKVEFYTGDLNIQHLQEADIITNSGFLRPLNTDKLKYVKPGVVIPLMYEEWELRPEELDIDYCKKTNIRVAGTWENHPSIGVFNYVGVLAVKMALNGGFEVRDNNIFIWSSDEFGLEAQTAFKNMKAKEVSMSVDNQELQSKLSSLDFIFVCDYAEKRNLAEVLDFDEIKRVNPSCGIVHLYGRLDMDDLSKRGLHFYPPRQGIAQTMTFTLAEVGLNPLVRLQAAGLKVAENMIRNNKSELMQNIV